MKKAILIKIESNHNNVRTPLVEGQIVDMPEVGKSLIMFAESLTAVPEGFAGYRMITTTPIVELEESSPGNYLFKTVNSTYRLEVKETV